jgi:NitT/TauT family transport system substrate-binding protein
VKPSQRPRIAARGGIVLIALLFILAACSSNTGSSATPTTGGAASGQASQSAAPSAPAEKATVTIGLSQPIFSFTPIYVGVAKNMWADENLEVKTTVFNSGTDNQQALLGDVITLGAGGYTEPINLTAQGVPTVIFATIQGALPYRLMVKPEITDLNQLDGKTLAVSKIGSLSDQVTRIALNKMGFDPNKVKYQQAGGSPSRLAALQSGAIDGTILDSPSYQLAEKAGFKMLLNVAEQLKGFPYEVLYAKKDKIEQNKDVFTRFMKGYAKAAAYATDPANEEEVLKIVADATGQKAEDLKYAYDDTIKDFPKDGAINKDGLQQALEGTQKFADVKGADKLKVDDIYYPDLVQAASGS